jgi:hypothetical protein
LITSKLSDLPSLWILVCKVLIITVPMSWNCCEGLRKVCAIASTQCQVNVSFVIV